MFDVDRRDGETAEVNLMAVIVDHDVTLPMASQMGSALICNEG
ncbi:MAG: hypothetical protein ACRDSR_08555 [Pseudonocardiaceae bacterium]